MKSAIFQNELTKTSAVFGRKSSVNVVFKGDQAMTDGSNIVLPSLDMNADMTDEQMDIMRGYVDHEAGHVRHTDFDALRKFGEECAATNNKLLKSVQNALEDIWLERRVRDDYAGAEHNLRATASAVNERFIRDFGDDEEKCKNDAFVGPVALTWEGRKDYGGDSCQRCLDLVSDDLRRVLPDWIKAVDHCTSTSDVIALSKVIEKHLRDGDYKDEDDETQGHGRGGADGDGAAADDGRSDDIGDDGEGHGDTEGDGRGRDEADTDERDGTSPAGGREYGGASDDEKEITPEIEPYEDFDFSSAVSEMAREGALATKDGFEYTVFDPTQDRLHHKSLRNGKRSGMLRTGSPENYDYLLNTCAGTANTMRNKLMRALMAKQQRDWDYGREEGRLDTRRLTSAFAGRTNVFKRRADMPELDTALTVLVDLSGSMYGHAARLANQCAISIAEAIDKAGVTYEILGFNNQTDVKYDSSRHSPYNYTRHEPLDMWLFKAFDERLFHCKGSIGVLENAVGGNNSDGDAILFALNRLLDRPEKRKVMITLSDGCPAFRSCDPHAGDQFTRNAVDTAVKSGVDIMGVGILDHSVEQFYPKHVVIDNIDDLAGAAMDQIARALLGERFVVDNSKLMGVA